MPPIPVRELTSTYARRYSNTARIAHGNFHMGMMRDVASWESPDGYCWQAVDMLCDVKGKIRKRGGYTSPSSSNRTAVVENLIGFKSSGVDAITGLWGSLGKAGAVISSIDPVTGAATTLITDGSAANFACRPFQHRNLMVFSHQARGTTTNDRNKLYFAGGGTGSPFVISAGAVTANDNRVTGIVPASLVAAHLGSIIELDDSGGAGLHYYTGRIVEITSSSACRVEPVPSATFTVSSGSVNSVSDPAAFGAGNVFSGRYGVSFGGRIVLGYTLKTQGTLLSGLAKGLDVQPYRVIWSALQSDPIPVLHGAAMDGESVLYPGLFDGNSTTPLYNSLDFPELGPPGITGLAAAGEGTLIVFGRLKTMRITGPLSTETQLNPDPTYSKSQISANVGCIEARSIQYTRMGLIFAGLDNLYLYDGSKMTALLSGVNEDYYQIRLRAGDTIYGSAYFSNRNHYYLSMSGSEGGLMFNLDQMQMTKMSNMTLFDSTPDPTDATQIWGVGWWDTTAAAPTFTKGQLIRLDPIFLPTNTNVNDGNGTAVLHVFESKSYPDGELPAKKRYTMTRFGFDQRGGTTTLVQADTQLNTQDASYVSVGSLAAGTEPQSIGFQMLPLLKKGQALEFKLSSQAACTSFELTQVEVSVQQPRSGRSN